MINDILDLSKIESGMMAIEVSEVSFGGISERLDRSFHQVAVDKGLDFVIARGENLPHSIQTDEKRLQQVLKNLLSNAFKFTDKGNVTLRMDVVEKDRHLSRDTLICCR